jgi:hypothetical protein
VSGNFWFFAELTDGRISAVHDRIFEGFPGPEVP